MDLDILIPGLTDVFKTYQDAIGDKKITAGEFQNLIQKASDVALDFFEVRDKVLIDLTK